jgi:hypothetical protein
MKRIFLFLFFAIALMVQNADAQTKKVTKKKPTTTSKSKSNSKKKDDEENFWTEKMMYGGYINYPSLGFGFFNMALTPMIGYKFTNFASAGLISNINYTWFRRQTGQTPINFVDFGIGAFARVRLFNFLLLHADYMRQQTVYDFDLNFTPAKPVREKSTPLNVGIGYLSGRDRWKYEIGVYYNVNYDPNSLAAQARDLIPFSYRAGITYNF